MVHIWASATIFTSVPAIANLVLAVALIGVLRRHHAVRGAITSPSVSQVARVQPRPPDFAAFAHSLHAYGSSASLMNMTLSFHSSCSSRALNSPTSAGLGLISSKRSSVGTNVRESPSTRVFESHSRLNLAPGFEKPRCSTPVKVRWEGPFAIVELMNSSTQSSERVQSDRRESNDLPRPRLPSAVACEARSRRVAFASRELSIALLQVCVSILQVGLTLPLTIIIPAYAFAYTATHQPNDFHLTVSITSNLSSFFVKSVGLSHIVNFFIYLIQVPNL